MIHRLIFLLVALTAMMPSSAHCQEIALKTNLLYDALLTPNIGVEIEVAPKWSVDLSGNYNSWAIDGKKWKHWLVQPEARYWLCQPFGGHFFGIHALTGQANVGHIDLDFKFLNTDFRKLKDHRYQGWYGGAGIAYGYSWLLGRHWNIEAEIGIGWIHFDYDRYECDGCGRKDGSGTHDYFGPTKAAMAIVYVF